MAKITLQLQNLPGCLHSLTAAISWSIMAWLNTRCLPAGCNPIPLSKYLNYHTHVSPPYKYNSSEMHHAFSSSKIPNQSISGIRTKLWKWSVVLLYNRLLYSYTYISNFQSVV